MDIELTRHTTVCVLSDARHVITVDHYTSYKLPLHTPHTDSTKDEEPATTLPNIQLPPWIVVWRHLEFSNICVVSA